MSFVTGLIVGWLAGMVSLAFMVGAMHAASGADRLQRGGEN